MAQGDPHPAWPRARTSCRCSRTGDLRRCSTSRWHAGIDLTGAPDGALILAPEDALIVGIDRGWSEGAKAAFLRTDSGLFLVLGGFRAGSHKERGITTGQRVKKGDKLGKVLVLSPVWSRGNLPTAFADEFRRQNLPV